MKKNIIIATLSFLFFSALSAYAQTGNAGIQLANTIANKMKDTLALTQQKRNQVFAINIQLHNQKMIVRQQNTNADSIRVKTQRVENTRDTLYKGVLPVNKYQLYLQKKRNLIRAN
jgi:hypothetical protein